MSLKHEIRLDDIYNWSELRIIAFEGIATSKHYKVLYEIQKMKNLSHAAAICHLLENKEFAELCVEYVNRPKVYEQCMEEVADMHHSFASFLQLPNREADFMIDLCDEQRYGKIFFFIDEGVELDVEDSDFKISRLLVDHFTDSLLYNDGDGWSEYVYDARYKDSISSKTVTAFRNYLADKQLLGDNNE